MDKSLLVEVVDPDVVAVVELPFPVQSEANQAIKLKGNDKGSSSVGNACTGSNGSNNQVQPTSCRTQKIDTPDKFAAFFSLF